MENVNRVNLSIIILSHNSKEHLKELLPSVFGSENVEFVLQVGEARLDSRRCGNSRVDARRAIGLPQMAANGRRYTAEVTVVDNGSTDGTVEWLKSVTNKIDPSRLGAPVNRAEADGRQIY